MLRSVFYDANVNGARWRKPYLGLEASSLVDADFQRFRPRRSRASDACLKYRWVPLEEPAPKTKRFFLGAMLATALLIAALPSAAQDFQKGMEAYRLGAFATALEHWKRLAEGGHAVAQNNVGTMYQLGEGVQQDPIEAAKWYRKAAEQGLVYAQSNLALMYFTGEGVGRNYTLAAKWYRKAAEQGNAEDQFSLGNLYRLGIGVGQDDAEAMKWYRRVAERSRQRSKPNYPEAYSKRFVAVSAKQAGPPRRHPPAMSAERPDSPGPKTDGAEDPISTSVPAPRVDRVDSAKAQDAAPPGEQERVPEPPSAEAKGEEPKAEAPALLAKAQPKEPEPAKAATKVEAPDLHEKVQPKEPGPAKAAQELKPPATTRLAKRVMPRPASAKPGPDAEPAVTESRIGTYRDWMVLVGKTEGRKTCSSMTLPIGGSKVLASADAPHVRVRHASPPGDLNAPSITLGESTKPESEIAVEIDGKSYRFDADAAEGAILAVEDRSRELIRDMIKGIRMKVLFTSRDGGRRSQAYSLLGFTRSYRRSIRECNVAASKVIG